VVGDGLLPLSKPGLGCLFRAQHSAESANEVKSRVEDSVPRANAAERPQVEQSASAVASLQAQADTLLATVDLFTLARHAQASAAPQRAGKPHATGSKRSSESRMASALA
jgi:hypothetical protein